MQHIEHLSQLLHDHVQVASAKPLSQAIIDDFFQSIASARIHFSPIDWQGHRVMTMLWHLPNLQPAKKDLLATYVTDQWDQYTWDQHPSEQNLSKQNLSKQNTWDQHTAEAPAPDSSTDAEASEHCPIPPAVPIDPFAGEPKNKTADDAMKASTNPQNHFLSTLSAPRRDWFDRFTDWVAAVVSLFA